MAEFIGGFRSSVRGGASEDGRQSGSNLLGTFARYPALAKAFLTFNGHLLYGSTLTVRQRELIILRVACVRHCDYEWAQHAIMAERAGMTDAEIRRIGNAPDSAEWDPVERALLAAVDESLGDGMISAETWGVLAGEWDEQRLMDVVFTIGTYEMLAMALRSFGVEPEEGLVPYLPDNR